MDNSRPREPGGSEPVYPIGWPGCPLEHPAMRDVLKRDAVLIADQLSVFTVQGTGPERLTPACQRRFCVVCCGGELQGHGNATAHPGE